LRKSPPLKSLPPLEPHIASAQPLQQGSAMLALDFLKANRDTVE
jgi:hypothetical protein